MSCVINQWQHAYVVYAKHIYEQQLFTYEKTIQYVQFNSTMMYSCAFLGKRKISYFHLHLQFLNPMGNRAKSSTTLVSTYILTIVYFMKFLVCLSTENEKSKKYSNLKWCYTEWCNWFSGCIFWLLMIWKCASKIFLNSFQNRVWRVIKTNYHICTWKQFKSRTYL